MENDKPAPDDNVNDNEWCFKKYIRGWRQNVISKLLKFKFKETMEFSGITDTMFKSTEASSLAAFRILFGVTMFLDIPDERGFSRIDERWGRKDQCTFPLVDGVNPLSFEGMCILYFIMWLGSVGITLGYKYRVSCLAFILPYWYLILIDKTSWNNHTYLFGLTSVLLFFTEANACWSLDKWLADDKRTEKVPFWNYLILRYQVFILYFMAGLKKFNTEWLGGHSMINLSKHMVFKPFKLILSDEQIDYWIVHVVGFLIDSFAGFGLCFDSTRSFTLTILSMFHLMNSRLFSIGMFPYVGIVTMFIFCDTDWPRKLLRSIFNVKNTNNSSDTINTEQTTTTNTWKKNIIVASILIYACLQLFLPYSHFITKGYNGWSNGLYGYSWDMMVHNWDTSLVRIKVVDNDNHREYFMDPKIWVQSERWTKHPDMVIQFVKCAEDKLLRRNRHLKNISVYMDVWCSLNGRIYQRMYDPTIDLIKAPWSIFEQPQWVMPLLTELNDWRRITRDIRENIYSKSDTATVLFLCDFPGLFLENYVKDDLVNASLEVLTGKVIVNTEFNQSVVLNEGNSFNVQTGSLHYVHTISSKPSCFMYSYHNYTTMKNKQLTSHDQQPKEQTPLWIAIRNEWIIRLKGIQRSVSFVVTCTLKILTHLL